jgi:ATP-dependent Lhr-like helicase
MDPLAPFHPVVRTWFARRFAGEPTEPQAAGWPAIARGEHVLIAAPTGSGKTLAAFLVCIDRLLRQAEAAGGSLPDETSVVYVSPLKALAADVGKNLEAPLAEIRQVAAEMGISLPALRVQLRSGDTTPAQRAGMLRRPPHLLVTTPESLYLLLTAEKSRERLRAVRTLILDEIHALAGDKRGVHLALSVERLAALCEQAPQRIGLSATQNPISHTARLLVGAGPERSLPDGTPRCTVLDLGRRRALDLAVEVPDDELGPVASHEQWDEILSRIAGHVERHATTLVFVNTRRLAERLAHRLAEKLGEEKVAAHHGSLSRERRLRVEERLRAGELRALVATASLELGIDVGPVELVCQIGSPRSLATLLQRVGRSGHATGRTPKGRLYPTTRDELVECAAALRGLRAGRLDRVVPPALALDVLAQQIVAACAAEDWREDDLYALVRRAAPCAELSREDFDAAVELVSEGVATGRGLRGAHLHRDRVHGVLRGRRGARIAALTSGGAIPETADYRVLLDPDDTFIGTVNEDWAIESMAGDVFLLGSSSWRIRRVEAGVVRVTDAAGAPPSVPFWLGEAPARTAELSDEVSELREQVGGRLARDDAAGARAWLEAECGLDAGGAEQIVRYLAAARGALGVLPGRRDVVFERFFDEAGGMQLVTHAPFGGRVNRALGLALRKRFCRSFDFELQAAASDDAIVLSLGAQQSFPLDAVPRFLSADSARDTLAQALLLAPAFAVRWRWNLGRALVLLRQRSGRRVPPPIQRMEADDLLAAVFPALAQCQENATGPIEPPDHLLVRQTLSDCLHEATDAAGLERLLRAMESGEVRVHLCESSEPSPLAHEILNARPYTFLDDAPLEERRTRAVVLRRGLPEHARELGRLDPEAIAAVQEEARPAPRDAEELHDTLLQLVVCEPEPAWADWFEGLARDGRATTVDTAAGPRWLATERRREVETLFPGRRIAPDVRVPAALAARPAAEEGAAAALAARGHLSALGPTTLAELSRRSALTPSAIEIALAALEAEGFALRGRFRDPAGGEEEFCERRLLARIHRQTTERLRREIEPVSAQDFVRFLLRWQHVAPHTRMEGRRGLLAVAKQIQGFELAAGAWEEAVLPARVADYRPEWLDELCLSGELAWARLALREPAPAEQAESPEEAITAGRGGLVPSRATPIAFATRDDLAWLLAAARGEAQPGLPGEGAACDVLRCLRERGALFLRELVGVTRRLPVEVEEGLWDLVSRGLVAADGFASVRTLLAARGSAVPRGASARRVATRRAAEGRWSLVPPAETGDDAETLAEAVAGQLLARWGVVFRDLLVRESLAMPWREVLWALRRMEARGTARGGRFVTGFVGEQYALPGAVEALRQTRRRERSGERVSVSAVDPLNLVGIVLPGPRVPALRTRTVVYRDGLPLADDDAASGPRRAASTPARGA